MSDERAKLALVVDDEDMVRDLLCVSLEEAGLTVLSAADGAQAKKAFDEHAAEIRLVLLDLNMLDIGGGELYDALVAYDSPAKYVLVSGYPERDALERFGREGLAGFLQKPFRIDALIDLARDLVDG